jgi:exosortase E/protease (VPEID-CTERM system)
MLPSPHPMSTDPDCHRRSEPPASHPEFHASQVSISSASALRLMFVVLVLAIEAIIPWMHTTRHFHFFAGDWIETALERHGFQKRYFALTFVAMTIILSWHSFRREAISALKAPSRRRFLWVFWLFMNLVFCLALIGSVQALTSLTSPADAGIWFALRAVLWFGALAAGALALMPASFWWRWYTSSRGAFLWGILLGFAVQWVGFVADIAWHSASLPTLRAAAWCLRLLGKAVVVDPGRMRVAIPGFRAIILYKCSGIEGVGLVLTFLSFYLWWYRDQLRLPRALLLLPIGMIAAWMLNVVRIVGLILIGVHNRPLALGGFHSAAGWILFNALSFGIVAASWQFESLSKAPPTTMPRRIDAAFYLVPFLAIAVTGMITHAFTLGFDFLYPLRVIAAMAALLYFRDRLASIKWSPSLMAIGVGAAVFVIWIALARGGDAGSAGFIAGLRQLSPPQSVLWLMFRAFGAVVTVPIAEELAFRGYLIRKFVSSDFETVSAREFTWFSFIASSALFGAFHAEWIAGTIAGMLFAYAIYRRGSLGGAIYAHATANALLAAYVLATGRWSLWE